MSPKKSSKPFGCLITDGAVRIVDYVARKYKTQDRHMILEHVCDEMERRYAGVSMEYHLAQMGIKTTNDLLDIIDTYLILCELEPSLSFVKNPIPM